MKRLSSTLLPPTVPQEHMHVFSSATNTKYIVVILTDGSIHILSSVDGSYILKSPLILKEYDGKAIGATLISSLVLNGDYLVVGGTMEIGIVVFDIINQTILYTIPIESRYSGFSALPSPPTGEFHFIVSETHGASVIYSIPSSTLSPLTAPPFKIIQTIHPHLAAAHKTLLLPPTSSIGTCSRDGKYCVTNYHTGEIIWTKQMGDPDAWKSDSFEKRQTSNTICAHCFWPGEPDKIIAGSHDGKIWIWEAGTGKEVHSFQDFDNLMQQIILYNNNEWLIATSWGEINIWSTKTWELLKRIRIFGTCIEESVILGDVLVGSGRDKQTQEDVCGLVFGVKGWKINIESGKLEGGERSGDNKVKEEEQKEGIVEDGGLESSNEEESRKVDEKELENGEKEEIIPVVPFCMRSGALHKLDDGRFTVCVKRGLKFFVEIWEV